jgi:hypothetical protein
MHIEIHGFTATIKRLTPSAVNHLCTNILHIEPVRFKVDRYNNMTFAFPGGRESVSLRLGVLKENPGHTVDRTEAYSGDNGERSTRRYQEHIIGEDYHDFPALNLHGSFFDNSPDFSMSALLGFLQGYTWTPKQLDICYVDDQHCISLEDWQRWAGPDWKSYCTGSLFKKEEPSIRVKGGKFDRIELASASSKTNYGTYYHRPNGDQRLEIKYKDKDKVNYLLADYNDNDRNGFNSRAVNALVSCIDILTPASKRTKSVSRYVRDPKFQAFIGSEPTKINWRKQKQEAETGRKAGDEADYLKTLQLLAARMQNFAARNGVVVGAERVKADLMQIVAGSFPTPALLS